MTNIYLSEDWVTLTDKYGGLLSINPHTCDALYFDDDGSAEAISIEKAKHDLLEAEKEMGKKLKEIKSALKKLEHIQPLPESSNALCEKIKQYERNLGLKGRT